MLSPGPHYTEGEDKEVVMDSGEKEDDEDGLEYKTEAPLTASYMTPPSTGGHSELLLILCVLQHLRNPNQRTMWFSKLQ